MAVVIMEAALGYYPLEDLQLQVDVGMWSDSNV